MWFRAVLDSDWNVYHDAASESGMGRHTDDHISRARLPFVLLQIIRKNKTRFLFWEPGLFRVLDLCLTMHAQRVRTSDRMYKHTFFWIRPLSLL